MADYSINAVTRRVVYTGSAGVGPYAFSFEILAQTDIVVYKDTTKLTLTTDYTVTINANGTGSVTLVVAANSGNRITIIGARAISRTTDFVTAGDLLASALNDQLDSQIIMLQQLAEENKRTMKAPQFDPAALEDGGTVNMVLPTASSRAGKLLTFDASGNPLAGEEIGDYKGNWATATIYAKRDLVKDTSNNNIYRCKTAHTSSGSQPISTNTDSAKWDLIVDAASATSSASAAAASASAAATSATNAASSASSASSSASTATTQASNASASATSAANSYNTFHNIYYGPSAVNPTTRPDSSAVQNGDIYYNTVSNQMRVYGSGQWSTVTNQAITILQNAFTGTGSQTAFTLSDSPASKNNIIVEVGGVIQTTDTYSVSGSTLTFSTAPSNGATIETRIIATNNNLNSAAASAVTFNQAGSGAITRDVQSKLREIISVTDFGADATGATDSTTAFTAAASAALASGISELRVPAGTYLLLDWSIPSGIRLVGAGRYKTKLKKNGGGVGTQVIKSIGTLGTATSLSSDVGYSNTTISVGSTASFTVGNYAVIRENTYVSGSAGRKQQIVRITAINSGTSISFFPALLESYLVANTAQLLPLSPIVDGGIFNLSVEGINANLSGGCIRIGYGVNFIIDDVHAQYCSDDAAFTFSTCYNSHIKNSSARDGINKTAGGYGYGLQFDEACAFSSVTNCYFENVRETTFTNRTAHCKFARNQCIGNYDSGFNTHGAFVNNCSIEDNEIVGTANGNGIAVGFSTHGAGDTDITIRRNKIRYSYAHGISVVAPSGKENVRIAIDNNDVVIPGTGYASTAGILVQISSQVNLSNNRVEGGSNNNINAGIYFISATNCKSSGDMISYVPNGYGFRYDACTDLRIDNPVTLGISSYNVYGTGANTRVFVNGQSADDSLNTVGSGASHNGVIQRGRAALTFSAQSAVTSTITFPAAYPTGVVPVVVAIAENNLGAWRDPVIGIPTNTGVSVTLTDDAGASRTGTAYINWIAIA